MPAPNLLEELKHSIKMHLLIMQGPTPQLAVFAVKVIDFLEDDNIERKNAEMAKLAFAIIEALVIHVQQSIDIKAQQAVSKGSTFPPHIQQRADHLLVVLGKSRSLPDKIVAKSALLREIAEALRSLADYTKAKYPTLTDIVGNPL